MLTQFLTHIRCSVIAFRKHFILVVWNMTRSVMHHRLLLLLLLSLKYIVVLSFLKSQQAEDRQQQRLFKMSASRQQQKNTKPFPDIFDTRGAQSLNPYEIVYKPGTPYVKYLKKLKYRIKSDTFCRIFPWCQTPNLTESKIYFSITIHFL